jgi:hypothetical protein
LIWRIRADYRRELGGPGQRAGGAVLQPVDRLRAPRRGARGRPPAGAGASGRRDGRRERRDSARQSDGRIIDANRRAEQLYSRTRDELCALPISLCSTTQPSPDACDGHRRGRALFERIHKTGDSRPFTAEISARWLANGAHLYLIRDVTSRKRQAAAQTADQLSASSTPRRPQSSRAVAGRHQVVRSAAGCSAGRRRGPRTPLPFVPPERRESRGA